MPEPEPPPSENVITMALAEETTLRLPCDALAPVATNGPVTIGCSLQQGHPGKHSVTMSW